MTAEESGTDKDKPRKPAPLPSEVPEDLAVMRVLEKMKKPEKRGGSKT